MFIDFLYNLRAQRLPVGLNAWLTFLQAMKQGLATDLDGMYHLGRSLLCRSETEYDQYDVAFAATFEGAVLPDDLREQLAQWLDKVHDALQGEIVDWGDLDPEELMRRFQETLREQQEEHHGGNRWIGTGGTSPYGHSGRARRGIRVGGSGGGRSAVRTAMERKWQNYRSDRTLDVRDLQVALRALRSLVREGDWQLDLDETIDRTARNAGDIEIVERREKKNRLKVVLLMDAGGSMAPHAARVEKLFTAASNIKTFKTFEALYFHNCVYKHVYRDFEQLDRVPTGEVLAQLTPQHRLFFVGDASMAPYELFSSFSWPEDRTALAGIDWLRRFAERCPASVWLNPDREEFWRHPTVQAIRGLFDMYPLTVDGLRDAVRKLRVPV